MVSKQKKCFFSRHVLFLNRNSTVKKLSSEEVAYLTKGNIWKPVNGRFIGLNVLPVCHSEYLRWQGPARKWWCSNSYSYVCLSFLESQWLQCSLHAFKSKQCRNLKYCRVVFPLMVWHVIQEKHHGFFSLGLQDLWYNSCFPLQMGIKLKSKMPPYRREDCSDW